MNDQTSEPETTDHPDGKSMCGGCVGSGRIINPSTGHVEKHAVCNGEGVR